MHRQLLEVGGKIDKIWPHEINQSLRGMVAMEDITKGEVVAILPYSTPIVTTLEDVVSNCRIVQKLNEKQFFNAMLAKEFHGRI